eukprot:gnl/TRDRNA2_/TRDRNA2_43481_c0_seq1.p1 gnl/TRDRNA2_/TRDRNA2_43481_c0~~gnl/TRDRNA2_/TRDRNA2_43481_c0_seq1.p1  ORF type:complete len:164 (+),score=31.14 gnl/TRDRNA2_/TRDRNA2_43481_c0_seq1:54-545(+)
MTAAAIDPAEKAHNFLFDDSFLIKSVDNTRFERAGRIDCESTSFNNALELDVNNIIYPVAPGEQVYLALTDNVSPADNPRRLATAYDHDPRKLGRSVMDQFEYVMYGKVYKKDTKKNMVCVFASFGGLLMKLTSDPTQLSDLHLGDSIYLLMRKVQSGGAPGF